MNLIYDIWTTTEYTEYIKYLKTFADKEYRDFQSTLVPTGKRVIGVKMPILRKLANEILKGNWRYFLELCTLTYYEETTIKGLVIGMSNVTLHEYTHLIDNYSRLVKSWIVCDTFCSGLKGINNYPDDFWYSMDFLLKSKNPWQVRMGLVTMLNFYLTDNYLPAVFTRLDAISSEHYYVKTGIAWLVTTAYVKYPETTYNYLTNCKLDQGSYQKTIEKLLELREISPEQKEMLSQIKISKKRPQSK
jgi:3-methyladenine DNA glycosylase AlkD